MHSDFSGQFSTLRWTNLRDVVITNILLSMNRVSDAQTDLSWLVAHENIRQLAARYALAVDSRDLDALVELYVDDVALGDGRVGRQALRDHSERILSEIGVSVLLVGTHVIDLHDATHGTGVVYTKAEIQDGEKWIHQAVAYDDRYECRDGRWYFVSRRHRLFYGAEVGISPLGLAPANWPEHHDGWGTLPAAWPTWQAFWARRQE
jgi:ketosteroid isomerase-like protein